MTEAPPHGNGSTATPVSAIPRRAGASRTGMSIDAQFEQVETLLAHAGRASGVGVALSRLRVHVAEQSLALIDLLEQDLRLRAEIEELNDVIGLSPLPVYRVDDTLSVLSANGAGRAFMGPLWQEDGRGALREALSRREAAQLRAFLPPALGPIPDLRGLQEKPVLRFSRGDDTHPARVTALRARKRHAAADAQWWLVLEPERSERLHDTQLRRHLLETTADQLCITDTDGRVLEANSAFLQGFDGGAVAVIGRTRREFMAPIAALQHAQGDDRVRATQRPVSFEEFRQLPATHQMPSRWVRVLTEKRPLFDDRGRIVGIVSQSRDVSERRRGSDLAEMVFEHSSDAIVLTDSDLTVLRVNAAFEQVGGFGFAQIDGRPLTELLRFSGGAARSGEAPIAAQVREALQIDGKWRGEIAIRTSEGRVVPCWARITRLDDAAGVALGHVAMFSDLTQLRQAQADNQRLANYDLLTGLPNRQFLSERLDGAIAMAERRGAPFAVLFLDLNGFKAVNDSLGHDTGDMLLNVVARRLREAAGDGPFVARIGGDEFVILLDGADAAAASTRALTLLEGLSAPLDLPGLHQYRPAGSIGIACYPAHGDSRDVLLRNADLAMYTAKQAHGAVKVYEAELGIEALRELEVRNALLGAVERNELVLHYQPLFRLCDGTLYGAEALVRWNRPGKGLEMPANFLPVAERAGLMPTLDSWVLREAITRLSHWRQAGLLTESFKLSINQTAADLAAPGWAETLTQTLAAHHQERPGAPPLGLQIELTEAQLAHGMPGAVETLSQLRGLGVRLAIDDFGTGYSSLAYLARLPVSMLKIASEFVRGIDHDANARLIVETITGLAQHFGYATLAEGIEHPSEVAVLSGMGCELGQGFVASPAIPQEAFEERFLRGGPCLTL
ncbi:hypothetical protein CKO11_11510 [Rhodobacter sp. TJ_12]|uniref:putative bifunctional diguanylate cyclase/phosphodiesterase n=1 Tax=Rhodobacter sp. TJ_12 TaxID=2029399 RepID=UPI001CC0F81E|nr:EAL domain-containing protein [Rhodobacter sp. TJ_12]MBZ4023086.1 hypothetical protein [Rhodobacter sp. TJ_12]